MRLIDLYSSALTVNKMRNTQIYQVILPPAATNNTDLWTNEAEYSTIVRRLTILQWKIPLLHYFSLSSFKDDDALCTIIFNKNVITLQNGSRNYTHV